MGKLFRHIIIIASWRALLPTLHLVGTSTPIVFPVDAVPPGRLHHDARLLLLNYGVRHDNLRQVFKARLHVGALDPLDRLDAVLVIDEEAVGVVRILLLHRRLLGSARVPQVLNLWQLL